MTQPEVPDPEPAPRRRQPWSFRSLVEDVSGRPITDFQDPPPKPAPSAAPPPRAPVGAPTPRAAIAPAPASGVEIPAAAVDAVPAEGPEDPDAPLDPVARIYPPLSGATARRLHGAEAEHHEATLRSVEAPEERVEGHAARRPPGPSRRPERIYLHYLLLHLDRLNDPGLRYLKHAVDEELAHREAVRPPPPPEPAPPPLAPPAV